ncbi:L-tyrosine 3-hydroxylase [Catellatospora sichuanensis]|uniref:L-tyrosine 3-hydroxylase n=1 Tax=Catellatospora sichuanensis TaxID=1969805 RepID=UPI001182DFDB|nr:L-tyrosine 3-hydroxylase [Catellatospora sichuanensis]
MPPMHPLEAPAVVTTLPSGAEWEFGGHPYGLEPLALPSRWVPRTVSVDPMRIEELRERLAHASPASVHDLRPDSAEDIDRLFWFRWITAHQTTFLLWQMLGAILRESEAARVEHEELATQARLLVCGYSLMLMYGSSAPRHIYGPVIRMPMARQHVNLTGAWARDYAPVRPLIRGKVTIGSGTVAEALRHECELNEQVHEGIADKVLSSGEVSLLQSPKPKGRQQIPRDTLMWLYDGIFLTSRAAVSQLAVGSQLVRRLHAIFLDITANGLYPSFAPSAHEEPPRLRNPEVMRRKAGLTDCVLEILSFVGAPATQAHPSRTVRTSSTVRKLRTT